METIMHIGAHRTGTTSLQGCLEQNRSRLLQEANLDLWTPLTLSDAHHEPWGGMRNIIYRDATRTRAFLIRRRWRRTLRASGPDRHALIFSEENAVGLMRELFSVGFYADATRRLANLSRNTGLVPSSIFFSIREYGSFFSSAYSFQAGRSILPDAEEARAFLKAQTRRWPELIADIRQAFPVARITIWRHELSDMQCRLEELTGLERLETTERYRNASPTTDAVGILRGLRAFSPLRNDQIDFVTESLPGGGPFCIWSQEDAQHWRNLYEYDLDRLRRMPGIELQETSPPERSPRPTEEIIDTIPGSRGVATNGIKLCKP